MRSGVTSVAVLGQLILVFVHEKKRLILCFDGTWNALRDPTALTNVVKLANLVTVSRDGVESDFLLQLRRRQRRADRPLSRRHSSGSGLKNNVKRGLTFLALNYEEGDEIYIFGFSRGAYTARARCGRDRHRRHSGDISNVETHWDNYQQIAKLRPDHRLAERCAEAAEGRGGDRVC